MSKTKKSKATKRTKSRKAQHHGHVMTIPELRRAFEHIESFVEIHSHKPKETLVKEFRQEWERTFKKEVDTVSAKAYVEHVLEQVKHKKPHERRHSGGAMPLAGAPLAYDATRPGLYVSAGVNQGSYAVVPSYVQSGFNVAIPEIAKQMDPVAGQTVYPTRTPAGLGDNSVMFGGGKKGKKTKQSAGGLLGDISTAVTQAMFRIPPPTVPPTGPIQIGQTLWKGQESPPPPNATHQTPSNSGPPYIMTPKAPILNLPSTGSSTTFASNVFF
jgi:hypothetical protein